MIGYAVQSAAYGLILQPTPAGLVAATGFGLLVGALDIVARFNAAFLRLLPFFCAFIVTFAAFTIGLQILTAPVSGHMLARTAYRTDQWDDQHAVMDELGDDLEAAGFTNITDEEGGSTAARHPLG